MQYDARRPTLNDELGITGSRDKRSIYNNICKTPRLCDTHYPNFYDL